MNRRTAILDALCLLALALWLGAVGMTGVTAAVVFPTMKGLAPSLPAYAQYPEAHWPIAAGAVARKVFDISAYVQVVCAVLALSAGGLRVVLGPRRPVARVMWTLLASGCLVWWLAILTPRMNRNLDTFWDAARSGKTTLAADAKAAFDMDHPLASRAISGAALFALLGVVECLRWAAFPPKPEGNLA
ncbi:MAG: hypothetical protein WC718_03585 [Phycisphaerales bacterium]